MLNSFFVCVCVCVCVCVSVPVCLFVCVSVLGGLGRSECGRLFFLTDVVNI